MNKPTISVSQKHLPLKLQFQDSKALSIISTFLQDTLVPLIGIECNTEHRNFPFLGQRFLWDKIDVHHEHKTLCERIQSFFHIYHVKEVKTQGIPEIKNSNETLNLLSVNSHESEYILLTFSSGNKVRLNNDQISAHLHASNIRWHTPAKPHYDI